MYYSVFLFLKKKQKFSSNNIFLVLMTRSLKIPHQMIMSAFQITGTKAEKGFKSLAQKKHAMTRDRVGTRPRTASVLATSHGLPQPSSSRLRCTAKDSSTSQDAVTCRHSVTDVPADQ